MKFTYSFFDVHDQVEPVISSLSFVSLSLRQNRHIFIGQLAVVSRNDTFVRLQHDAA